MAGVMTVPEALRMAEDKGLDLIEIAPNATPPTCKIMDYGKYKYEEKKKAAASRKNQVIVTIKEIQMRPRTDIHDFETKMKHARRFILDGDKVKINYLEVPVLGKFNFHQQTFDLNLFAGPSIAYGISGVTYFSSTTNGITNTDKQTINFKNDQINRVDVDLNFGMGATFPMGINSVFFDFRYQFGISNMASPASTPNAPINSKSSAIIIQAGISFPLSTPHPVAPPKK